MLYNQNWEKTETKPDVFSLASLIAWLETMPADGKYEFFNCEGECLYGQYMKAHGFAWTEATNQSDNEIDLFETLVYDSCASQKPYTFGAALSRALQHKGTV